MKVIGAGCLVPGDGSRFKVPGSKFQSIPPLCIAERGPGSEFMI